MPPITYSSRHAGSKLNDELLEELLDPQNFAEQEEVATDFIEEMNSHGYNLETGNFRRIIRDATLRRQWIDSQLKKGRLELTLKKEAIQMHGGDVEDFAKSIAAQEEEMVAWEIKDEEALDEDAKLIKEMLEIEPRLAAQVYKDRDLQKIVDRGLSRLGETLEFYQERFDDLEKRLHERASATIEAMNLPEKLESHADRFERLITASSAEQEALEKQLAGVRSEQERAKIEADFNASQQAHTIRDLETSIQDA
ncbi:MAG: hypothetical protein Q9221_003049 [Calogaya cf. arnoldii]